MNTITEKERVKYAKTWSLDQYSDKSPGLRFVDFFCRTAKPNNASTILDIGAGSGAASSELSRRGYNVTAFDLQPEDAWPQPNIPFYSGCVWRDLGTLRAPDGYTFDWGYCCDVMEHLPTEFVALSVSEMLRTCERVFLSVCFSEDVHGDAIRDRLHLTIKPFSWWRNMFQEVGVLYNARDLLGNGSFIIGRAE